MCLSELSAKWLFLHSFRKFEFTVCGLALDEREAGRQQDDDKDEATYQAIKQ